MKILAKEGIPLSGIEALEIAGYTVITTKVAQIQLENYINKHQIDAIIVRNTTQVRQELIENCPSLKLIGVAGVDLDNIDVAFAIDQGLHVISTPNAISNAVAELVFAHLFGMVRFLHQSNREMPLEGDINFNLLKKSFSAGTELHGKTLGIVGFGRVGQAVAKIALGLGMKVIASDPFHEGASISLEFFNGQKINFYIETTDLDEVLEKSDFISLHTPSREGYVLGKQEISKLKRGAGIINTAQGGSIDEIALLDAIKNKAVKFAGLDVFEKEPQPEIQLLMNPELSLTPNIGAATMEAQSRIGNELADQIIQLLPIDNS
jgi:D-3-phosphoglycerate dehydrogenase